jgi:stearoyl-CoA desaturase (delta-9 desaturase)
MTPVPWNSARAETMRRNWVTTSMFGLTFVTAVTVVPWYGFSHGYGTLAWLWFVLLLGANGMAITCGYHRLFAHATYEAHPVLKVLYLLFGAMALQNSALVWSAGHRVHHRHLDDLERDPYCAKRGFWFSHIGWMLRHYPSGRADFRAVRDLERDPLLRYQHRHYLALALAMNIGLPLLLGWASGDLIGVFLLAAVLRLVVSHHVTFFINSLAHIWGTQPYTEDNTARDNPVIAFLTYGEGYHNFHHMFSHDYRNGVRAWQWDPSKWFIALMSRTGLAWNLKRVPRFKIQRALLAEEFRRAEIQLAQQSGRAEVGELERRVAEEYEKFSAAVAAWGNLREQAPPQGLEQGPYQGLEQVLEQGSQQGPEKGPEQGSTRREELERELKSQHRRLRALREQLSLIAATSPPQHVVT